MLLISTTSKRKSGQLRKNWLAVTQRHLRLNALHTIKLQTRNLKGTNQAALESKPLKERMVFMTKHLAIVKHENTFFTFFLYKVFFPGLLRGILVNIYRFLLIIKAV